MFFSIDMKEVEKLVRSIEADGLLWGACELLAILVPTIAGVCSYLTHQLLCIDFVSAKLVPLAYGIKKLQISCVVEDDKVCGGCVGGTCKKGMSM